MLLKSAGDAQKFQIAQNASRELESDGKVMTAVNFRKSGRHTDRGNPRQVRADRVKITQIHLERVACFLAESKRSGGGGRSENRITFRKRAIEILLDESSHLERAVVILIVVPRG